MKYFLYKLIPPRPTFPQDMTELERKLMQEHVAYWKDLANRRIAIVFGPVSDPRGTYGLARVKFCPTCSDERPLQDQYCSRHYPPIALQMRDKTT
jgi:hypothetical protein